jgi:hypothetical protein
MAVSGGSPSFTTITTTSDASISGLTVGKGAGSSIYNTVVGLSGLSSASNTGVYQTAIGWSALVVNTTGIANTALGAATLYANTTGSNNVAVGSASAGNSPLQSNTTGSFNTAIGNNALGANTVANYTTMVGAQAGYSCNTSETTGVGYQCLYSATGGQTTALGFQAGYGETSSGGAAVYVGWKAGKNVTNGAYGVYVGYNTQPNAASDNYTIVIGASAATTGKGSGTGFINPNSGGVYQGNNSAAWSVTSDQRLKKNIVDHTEGLDKIIQIRVRNFEYRTEDEVTDLPKNQAVAIQGVQLGVIAQELAEVLPDCVKTESSGVMSVNQDNITWHMINAIKDLKAELDTVKAELAALKG